MNNTSQSLLSVFFSREAAMMSSLHSRIPCNNISSLKDSGQYDAGACFTSMFTGKLTKKLQEAWLLHTHKEREVPDIYSQLHRILQPRQSHPRGPELQFIEYNINGITEAPVQHAEERGTPSTPAPLSSPFQASSC